MTEQQVNATDTPEHALKVLQFKNQLGDQLNTMYREFVNFVQNLPTNPTMKARALGYFDDGILWINESIRVADIKINPVVVPTENDVEKQSKAS